MIGFRATVQVGKGWLLRMLSIFICRNPASPHKQPSVWHHQLVLRDQYDFAIPCDPFRRAPLEK